MNFLLYPISILFSWITAFRNRQYDLGFLPSTEFDIPVICVGNLSAGGNGKTPMIEYLVDFFLQSIEPESIAVLSRGYKRKSKGFWFLDKENHDPFKYGDESTMLKQKFPCISVVVSEDRALAIPTILAEKEKTRLILMDDGFQHRQVRAGLNILLTDYTKPFFTDHLLPAGRLREARQGAKRADIIVVTKSPENYDKEKYIQHIQEYIHKDIPIFFSGMRYDNLVHFYGPDMLPTKNTPAFSLCGIANPNHFEIEINNKFRIVKSFRFADHFSYKKNDLNKIAEEISHIHNEKNNFYLITTAKDAVKIAYLAKQMNYPFLKQIPMYYLPLKFFIYGKDEENVFKEKIGKFISM